MQLLGLIQKPILGNKKVPISIYWPTHANFLQWSYQTFLIMSDDIQHCIFPTNNSFYHWEFSPRGLLIFVITLLETIHVETSFKFTGPGESPLACSKHTYSSECWLKFVLSTNQTAAQPHPKTWCEKQNVKQEGWTLTMMYSRAVFHCTV